MDNKKQIEVFREKIKQIVNEADPWYLLEMEAPDDEYDKHIDNIVSFIINTRPSSEVLNNKLKEIFSTAEFELDKDKIDKMAKDLLQLDLEGAFIEKI